MDPQSTRKSIVSGLAWQFFEKFSAKIVSVAVSVVLARLLMPEDYGSVALVLVFITLMNVLVSGGFPTALIQKKDADSADFSTVFYFNLSFSICIYLILYFCAGVIARFYNMDNLVWIIRVLALRVPISAINGVWHAFVSRNMMFKKFFLSSFGGTVGSAVVGLTMAYAGFGVWALVAQYLFDAFVDTVVLWVTVRWRPTWEFSFKKLKTLAKFGWKMLASQLLNTGYNELRSLIIGRVYSATDLSYYTQGVKYPKTIVSNVSSSIDSVLLPAMSNQQADILRVKEMTRRSIKTGWFLMCPVMMGMAICANSLVSVLLTDKWLPCVVYLQIACFSQAFVPISSANLQAINALGRSDLFLKMEIIKKSLGIIILFLFMRISVLALALSGILVTVISVLVNTYPNRKLLGYKYREQIADVLPSTAMTVIMGAVVNCFNYILMSAGLRLFVQIVCGVSIYIGLSKLFKVDSYNYILSTVGEYFKGHKAKKDNTV
ncbi:MAG: lipopolysaccharide biosynthesis protein [bacterium]|nr:lipopolysaccharide biosynthesis protein [bacterium]